MPYRIFSSGEATSARITSRIRCSLPATSGGNPAMYSSTVAAAAMRVSLGRRPGVGKQPQALALVEDRVSGAVRQTLAGRRQLAAGRVTDQLADERPVSDHDDGCRRRRRHAPRVADDLREGAQAALAQVRP